MAEGIGAGTEQQAVWRQTWNGRDHWACPKRSRQRKQDRSGELWPAAGVRH